METYTYKANTKQGIVALAVAPIAIIGGIWLLLNDYVLGFGFGDSGPALGPAASKVIWVLLVPFGVAMLVVGLRALRVNDQQIQITDSTITVPKGEFGNEMVTIRRGQVTSLKTYANQGTRSLMIKYDGGKTKLVNTRFESSGDYDAAVAAVVAFAGVPVTKSKL